jgi:hypothetical protein
LVEGTAHRPACRAPQVVRYRARPSPAGWSTTCTCCAPSGGGRRPWPGSSASAPQQAARGAARYVESVRPPGAVVVTSPHVAWLYPAPVSDFLQAGAATGAAVAFYPPAIPPGRFRFSPSLESGRAGPGAGWPGGGRGDEPARWEGAAFAVLDPYWDAWARESDVVARLTAEVERWPLVWSEGAVRVHRRPGA